MHKSVLYLTWIMWSYYSSRSKVMISYDFFRLSVSNTFLLFGLLKQYNKKSMVHKDILLYLKKTLDVLLITNNKMLVIFNIVIYA